MNKTEDLENLKRSYISWAMNQVANGCDKVHPEELKIITDSIKDIAEAEKCCYEAEYYKSIVTAMEEPREEDAVRAYYRPSIGNPSYSSRYNSYTVPTQYSNDITSPYMENSWRMDEDPEQYIHGKSYANYKRARRHYTETHSDHDKDVMNANANSHMANVLSTIREMWVDADPTLRTRMKTDLTNLMAEMNSQ